MDNLIAKWGCLWRSTSSSRRLVFRCPLMMTISEWRWRSTGDSVYLLLAAAQVALIVFGWGAAQYPYLVRPELTIYNSAASTNIVSDADTTPV
jgi:cytochrome bd-type quinol oxidase subunit 2